MLFAVLTIYLGIQRLSELVLSRRHARLLRARGARELAAIQMVFFVVLHGGFFLALLTETYLYGIQWSDLWPLWLILFAAAQAMRFWCIHCLGAFWNARILILPGMTLIRTGPYRWIRHPNYLAVVMELAAFPLLVSAWRTALALGVFNGAMLFWRIRAEEAALRQSVSVDGWTDFARLPRFFPRFI